MTPSLAQPNPIARRFAKIGPSIFSTITQLSQEHRAINLGQGFPDFSGPENLLKAIAVQVQTCHNQYAPSSGEPELSTQVSRYVEHTTGTRYDPNTEITITSGASEGIFSAIQAFVNPGDRVLVFEPAFDLYSQAIASAGGVPCQVRLHAPDTPVGIPMAAWTLDWQEWDAAVASGFSLAIFNSPHNPTGKIFSSMEMERIAEGILAAKAIVIADEVYENLIYDGSSHESLSSFQGLQHMVVRVSSAAKTFGFTGLKVGWVCAPPHLTQAIRIIHQSVVFCVSPFTQLGLAQVMDNTAWFYSYLEGQKQAYQQKRDYLRSALVRSGFTVGPCEGTFFITASYESFAGDIDSLAFAKQFMETHRIATIPLGSFYSEPPKSLPWVRFAFCKTQETLNQAAYHLLNC